MRISIERRALRRVLTLAAVAAGLWLLGSAALIEAKALLAQRLIAAAWDRSAADGLPRRPWPWADTWPVARLSVPRLDTDLYALHGHSGSALAFGPGMVDLGRSGPDSGPLVLAGHRDTHFAFLRDIRRGDTIRLQRPGGRDTAYRVDSVQVVDSRREGLPEAAWHGGAVVLSTCYPFDAVRPGGPLRFVVVALRIRH